MVSLVVDDDELHDKPALRGDETGNSAPFVQCNCVLLLWLSKHMTEAFGFWNDFALLWYSLLLLLVVVLHNKNPPTPCAHAVPLASARQHPENQKENQAGHSSERTVEGQLLLLLVLLCIDDGELHPRTRRNFPSGTWELVTPPPVEFVAWLPVRSNPNKTARSSVLLVYTRPQVGLFVCLLWA